MYPFYRKTKIVYIMLFILQEQVKLLQSFLEKKMYFFINIRFSYDIVTAIVSVTINDVDLCILFIFMSDILDLIYLIN